MTKLQWNGHGWTGWGLVDGTRGSGEFITSVAQLHRPPFVEVLFSAFLNWPCLLAPGRLLERNWWWGGASFIPVKWAMFHFETSIRIQWVKKALKSHIFGSGVMVGQPALEKLINIYKYVQTLVGFQCCDDHTINPSSFLTHLFIWKWKC